jgi:putative ABC transport system substrate-binding protein
MIRALLAFALATLLTCLGPFGFPGSSDAEQPLSPRHIGVLLGGFPPAANNAQQFRQGLLDAGYAEGRDVVIEWRSANGDFDRLPSLVGDLVQRKVEVIVVITTAAAQAAKRATSTTPIVMTVVADPIRAGVVTNLSHPGGNVTGLSMMMSELTSKRLQLLKEAIPRLRRVAVLGNPDAPYYPKVVEDLKAMAPFLELSN